jgi:hypothetical protein
LQVPSDAQHNLLLRQLFSGVSGVFSEISVNENYTLTQRFYAHRVIKELFVVEVEVEYTVTDISPLSFTIQQPQWTASYDLTFGELESDIKDVT